MQQLDFQQQLNSKVLSIKRALGIGDRQFSDMLNLSSEAFRKLKEGKEQLSLSQIRSFVEAANLNINLLFSGKLDLSVLEAHQKREFNKLPERYSENNTALSRTRGIHVIYSYLKDFHGETYARQMLQRLQVFPDGVSDLVGFVSPKLGMDLLGELRKDGFGDQAIKFIGMKTLDVNRNNLGRKLADQKTGKWLFEYLHEEILTAFYDRVFSYRLESIALDHCIVTVRPQQESIEAFKGREFSDRNICLYKQGAYLSFIWNLPIKSASLHESECMFKGDATCRYHITWQYLA